MAEPARQTLIRRVAGRMTGAAGAVVFSGAGLLLALILQAQGGAEAFGLYAFGQVATGGVLALSGGLFATPMIASLARDDGREADRVAAVRLAGRFFVGNLAFCLLSTIGVGALMGAAGATPAVMALTAAVCFATAMRWFLRSLTLAWTSRGRRQAIAADLIYGVLVVVGAGALVASSGVALEPILRLQMAAALLSCVPLMGCGWRAVKGIFVRAPVEAAPVRRSWLSDGGWSVAATAATAVTAGLHGYLVTLGSGAAAFAPLAFAVLLFRPSGVLLTALVLFERPSMARSIHAGNSQTAADQVRMLRVVMALVLLANAALAAMVLAGGATPIGLDAEGLSGIGVACVLVGLSVALRAMREPAAARLQAGGELKPLAVIAGWGAAATAAVSIAIWLVAPQRPEWVLTGMLAGEATQALLIERRLRIDRRLKLAGSDAHVVA